MRTVVCLPTRNEKDSIELMVRRIRKLKLPLFVADSDSDDGTKDIAKRLRVPIYQRSCPGKGCGVQTALAVAKKGKYDLLVFIDCDDTYPVDAIPQLIKLMDRYDMVLGARDYGNVPPINRIGNVIHTWATNILYLANLRDINTGLRVMKVDKFEGQIDAKSFDVEAQITVRALKRGMKVKEIKIPYNPRIGQSKLRISDGVSILWRIIKERFTA